MPVFSVWKYTYTYACRALGILSNCQVKQREEKKWIGKKKRREEMGGMKDSEEGGR